jgi:dephospho-CoA kinase
MRKKNLILGITGNIASGKSTVARAFSNHGAVLVDADQLARDVVAPDSPVLQQLVAQFGMDILQENGELDRKRLGQIVFSDADARRQLNNIIHPAIARLAIERLTELKEQPGVPMVIYEAPLLFEAGAEGRVDQVLVVKIDPEIQLQRLMEREDLDEAAALQRITAQMPQQEKLARADYVIDNSGTVEEALLQVDELWQQILDK